MNVTLNSNQFSAAALCGLKRQLTSIMHNAERKVTKPRVWDEDINGACAEMAVAKALDIFWTPSINTFKAPDVGPYQVRSTTLDNGCLILRAGDSPTEVFIFVTGIAPDFILRGWLMGSEGMREEHERDPHGHGKAWFVPQNFLAPMDEL